MEKKTSIYDNALIWFGAGVSIAEILTGTYYASMSFKEAMLAILIGHLCGFILMSLSLVSIWMYTIGLTGAMATGQTSLSAIFSYSGIGSLAIVIIILSTVTTTFLDAYSAGISFEAIKEGASAKMVAIIVSALGILGALLYPMDDISNFLYLIGSVFAPMIAVQIADFFIKKDKSSLDTKINIVSWVIGFIIYRILLKLDIVIGASVASVILTILVSLILRKIFTKSRLSD